MTARLLALVLIACFQLAAPLAAAVETFTVTGRFLYVDKAWGFAGWTGEDPELPIRRADVIVMDAITGKTLGRGATDNNGEFAVEAATKAKGTSTVSVVARVETQNRVWAKAVKLVPRVAVQAADKLVYSAFTPTAQDIDPTGPVDLGTTVVPALQVGLRDGNPFNVFDMAVAAIECLTGPRLGVTRRVRGFKVTWPNVLGSYSLHRRAWISTDDGYDDAVILHEIGHVVHTLYSDSDNPGGPHFFGDSDQDPRLSFGEGFATAFAGLVLEDLGHEALYVDSRASVQLAGMQIQLDLETSAPYFDQVAGASDEVAVACVLYDIGDEGTVNGGDDDALQAGVPIGGLSGGLTPSQALWRVMTGPVKRARALTMNHAWDGWLKLHGDQPGYEALRSVYEDQRLRNWVDAFEPDDTPDLATPLALTVDDGWGAEHTLYRGGTSGHGKRDRDWFSVELEVGQTVRIETRYPAGVFDAATQVDPSLVLFDPKGRRAGKDDDAGPGRNAALQFVATQQGTWHFVVRSRNPIHRYGRYDVRVLLDP